MLNSPVVLNIILLTLAGLSFLGAVVFAVRAFGARSGASRQAYQVGQVEARRSMQVNVLRAGMLFVLGLIFLGVYGILPGPAAAEPEALPVEPGLPAPGVATRAGTPQGEETVPLIATVPPSTPTVPATPTTADEPATPTTFPSPTPVPQPLTATVSSGVGVWLRSAPGTTTEQLEWLLDGTVVALLEGQQTVENLVWQQVRTEAGLEGWVARDYLVTEPVP
jgi:hypothetical protein